MIVRPMGTACINFLLLHNKFHTLSSLKEHQLTISQFLCGARALWQSHPFETKASCQPGL